MKPNSQSQPDLFSTPTGVFVAAHGSPNFRQEPGGATERAAVRSGVGGVRLPRQAISIRQPWAWLIVNGWKNIENRMWRTSYRGPVLIHAAKGMTRDEYNACRLFMAGFCDPDRDIKLPAFEEFDRGGVVGVATILACVDDHESEWFCGEWGFVLADARPLPFFAFKGALSFFRCEYPQDILSGGGGAEHGGDAATNQSGANSGNRGLSGKDSE